MHYSPSAEAFKDAKKESQKLKLEEKELRKQLLTFRSKSSISKDEVDANVRALTSEIEILQKEYEVAVAIYRESNIHARRDEIDGSHPALQAPIMEIDINKFQDIYTVIKSVPASNSDQGI